jgi:hypothetical protein
MPETNQATQPTPPTPAPPAPPMTKYSLKGSLVFDNGLPAAAITTRLYGVGFAGNDSKLGEVTSDAQGAYSIDYQYAQGQSPALQVRVVDSGGKEATISNTKHSAATSETLNLVVPATVEPLAPEYQRLTADIQKSIGTANLRQTQESADRQDITLLNRSTNWDARLVALAATAAQQADSSGIGEEVLYALFRVGLPTDPSLLAMVSPAAVQAALNKAVQSGIVAMTASQITAAGTAFQGFASKTRLSAKASGTNSSFGDLLSATALNSTQQTAFANLYFSGPTASDFWTQADNLGIAAETLDGLKLQGKFLYLTSNNAQLVQKLQQEIGSVNNISQLADKDFHLGHTWQSTLTALAGTGGDQALQNLIPVAYQGATTADRLAAYAGDMARKVRIGFPTQVVARMIERNDLPIGQSTAPSVTAFLRGAAQVGYALGRTPLNAFLESSAKSLPALDADGIASLKRLYRLYQITPSSESLQAAVKLGFNSARDIAKYPSAEFMSKFAGAFPPGEAGLVYNQAQTVSAVTFNFFAVAQQLDNTPPVYALSGSPTDRQNAKNAIIQQFPSMATLFGNMDYCNCEDCQSVLSAAAYFVDVLEFLNGSQANAAGYTPLDVLIGSTDKKVPGRRPDLGALPLTCDNTKTAMPYIDIVNEVLEYYIANSRLDTDYAYDTGSISTADLRAEPQHILPQVYNGPLKQAVFPLGLPFDLWIATVRGFLNYFQSPLAQVLDTLRPVDNLELFTDATAQPYYRAQIFAEALGFSPSEYQVLTSTDATATPLVSNWFKLYGYPDEATALNGKLDPTDITQYLVPPLKNAQNLAQLLGLSYQDLTDLVTTGFLNPALYPLIYQFERFGIEMNDAFQYTNQPGFQGQPSDPNYTTAGFEAFLQTITTRYKTQNSASTFDAKAWLVKTLPANYSRKVLVLADPNSGCNFAATTLQYADNATAATPLDFVKLNLFARLWKKTGWSLDEIDRALQLFFPATLPAWTDPTFGTAFSATWKTALVYLAHLNDLNTRLAPALGRVALLPLWSNLPVEGDNSIYAQLFLTPSVLNNDSAFDDPNGLFPAPQSDLPAALKPFTAHLPAVQGVLGLTADEVTAILIDAGVATAQTVAGASFSLANLSICYAYSTLAKCLQIEVTDMIALKAMSGLNPFHALSGAPLTALADDVLFNQTLLFIQQVQAVQNSGFTVGDLQYLLRHQFDPVGKYQPDENALMTLIQSIAGGLQAIESANAVPANLASQPESLIDQSLSALLPAPILKLLFMLLTNAQTFKASQGGVATAIDPTPFAQEAELSFSYDPTTQTQTIGFAGLLLDWKKTQLETLNTTPLFSGLLNAIQQQAQATLGASVGNLLGVWASLMQYEAVQTGTASGIPAVTVTLLTQADPAISLSYDQTDQLQWLGYRGVLTDAKKSALTAVNISPALAPLLGGLLSSVAQQAMPAYRQMVGSFLAMWTNVQTFEATQTGVATASAIDPVAFASALAAAQQSGTITAAVPSIQLAYNAGSQTQTLTCSGVLMASMQTQLAALMSASTLLANLLQAVRTQAVNAFQSLAANLLTVAATDLDAFAAPFVNLDMATQQKQVKAGLVGVFMPLMAQKLSRQLILQTLSSNLGADPSLTEALATDAALLGNPSNPGRSLLGTFLALGQQGVSASYFASSNGSGTAQAGGRAATTDTADPTNSVPGTRSAHFEGYLQVPTDGPYRFFAELGNSGAAASLELDAPDPAALLTNPVIAPTSAAPTDHSEISQFVQLKGGVLYHFALDFTNLGANGASVLIQGENLPMGPLSQITLHPEQTIAAFARANTLLAKVVQILQTTSIDLREISYLVANAAHFSNLKLSSLPTRASDDSPANAIALFAQFLTLADYADLRRGPAGGTDGLIDVFENVGETFTEPATSPTSNSDPTAPWTAFANLTRRDPADVRAIGEYFGLIQEKLVGTTRQVMALGDFADLKDFGNNRGIRRVWQALQLLQIVGIPVGSLTVSTVVASLAPPAGSPAPDVIAANFKNAVKSQYTADNWRPIAQSVFDNLRKQKRDALVTYLLNTLDLADSNQLFEYFLIDPGMEPVVQTSRLRLAMSSLQTFVQRCLLNLENGNTTNPAINVSPSAVDADTWEWMKRYRVWQANREIFLYPENWMVPEFRLNSTDLFQALEGTLLQGDVTSDLVESALMTYLRGLDVYARLDIVASYLDQTNPEAETLYVLGRTYSHPHKYFYRTYANGVWSGWLAVNTDIEGDHIALALWRGRLNLFWLTFVAQPEPATTPSNSGTTEVAKLSFGDLVSDISVGQPQQQYQVQLHWTEYYQGKWTTPIASDLKHTAPIAVRSGFDINMVHLHVSKEVADNQSEGALNVVVDFPRAYIADMQFLIASLRPIFRVEGRSEGPPLQPNYAFRITSKNCDPVLQPAFRNFAPMNPYNTIGVDATVYTGAGTLAATFATDITTSGGSTTTTESILENVNNYSLLACANAVVPPFLDPTSAVNQEAGSLVSPFFYKDTAHPSTSNELTFFVQPSLTEQTVREWVWWAISPSVPTVNWSDAATLNGIDVVAQVPIAGPTPVNPGDPVYSRYSMQTAIDWVTNDSTAIAYGNAIIGKGGGTDLNAVSSTVDLSGVRLLSSNAAATQTLTVVGRQGLSIGQLRNIATAPIAVLNATNALPSTS